MSSSASSPLNVRPAVYYLKRQVSKVKLWLWIRLGLVKKVLIQPYAGYGNKGGLYIAGRVLADRNIQVSNPEDRFWKNFDKMRRRFFATVFPEVEVIADFSGQVSRVFTDEEGYFEFKMDLKERKIPEGWHPISLSLAFVPFKNSDEVQAVGEVYFPAPNPEYGIISDIDDTILSTGAMRLWEMLKVTFSQNTHTRIPFAGVSEFYDALRKGGDGILSNPIFYVSSSPWNIYDFLLEFLDIHQIPRGPLMLRDLGLSREQWIAGSHSEHKLKKIARIFEFYPDLQFILIGDSGQDDPMIYLETIKRYPARVLAVYIRDVSAADLGGLSMEYLKLGVELLLVKDTLEAAHHALAKGWIKEADTWKIEGQKTKDEKQVGL